jgi:hypothetical protein
MTYYRLLPLRTSKHVNWSTLFRPATLPACRVPHYESFFTWQLQCRCTGPPYSNLLIYLPVGCRPIWSFIYLTTEMQVNWATLSNPAALPACWVLTFRTLFTWQQKCRCTRSPYPDLLLYLHVRCRPLDLYLPDPAIQVYWATPSRLAVYLHV